MSESTERLPEWMLRLENKRKKQHRLAHDIGAGAPCFVCQDKCPGLDLHFWRKLCRNCKCKKEDHDVKDDEGYEQFEILLGNTNRKSKKGGVLKIKVPENIESPVLPPNNLSKGISFDWLPPNVSEEVAAEYMQQLPVGKLPISGSDGALYRRQQLTKQVPLHDLDAKHCDNLTQEEIEQLVKYLENLKNNVVGQGCVGKVFVPGAGKPLSASQSADPIRPLPPLPPAYNSMPRPFHVSSSSSAYGSGEDDDLPPPLPSSLPPRMDLKMPSEFLPDWRLPDSCASVLGKVVEGVNEIHLNPQNSSNNDNYVPQSQNTVAQSVNEKPGLAISQQYAAQQGSAVLQSQTLGRRPDVMGYIQTTLEPTQNALSTAEMQERQLMNTASNHGSAGALQAHSVEVASAFPINIAHSSAVSEHGMPLSSKPLVGKKSAGAGPVSGPVFPSGKTAPAIPAKLKYGTSDVNESGTLPPLPVDGVITSSVIPHTILQSSAVGTDALPRSAQVMQQLPVPAEAGPVTASSASAAPFPARSVGETLSCRDCHECGLQLYAGDIAVFAERAGSAAWHPSCFVCFTCKELLVDLMYFYYKNNVYCGRHFAELLGIPRCFACDELIFVKEYTVAEGKAFHVKHFCCYECDDPLAGKQYTPVDDQPVCLECYEQKYGRQCHTCQRKIAANEQRVTWKHLNWHVQGNCFRCFECAKSLLGGRFVVKENQPFCSRECVQAGLQKMAGAA